MGLNRDFKIRGYTVGQMPNLPLIVVIVAAVAGRMTEQGSVTNRLMDSVFLVIGVGGGIAQMLTFYRPSSVSSGD